jgi:cell division protein FtsL
MLTMTTPLLFNNLHEKDVIFMKNQDKTLILVLALVAIGIFYVGFQLYQINDTLKELVGVINNK